MENEVKVVVKWNGKEYDICNLSDSDSVGTLKNAIHKETGVRPERQKLLNLKLKGIGLYAIGPNFRLCAVCIVFACCFYIQDTTIHVVRLRYCLR
jgi:hypothetical protein